jgi:ankyrin repeat protein
LIFFLITIDQGVMSTKLETIDFCNEVRESERDFELKAPETEEEREQQELERQKELEEAIEDDRKFEQHLQSRLEDDRGMPFERRYLLKYADRGDESRVRKCLDAFPSSIRTTDEDGYTALHRACHNPNVDLVRLLVARGADLECQTGDGWRPVHCAAYWGNVHVLHLLISYGVNVNARTKGNNCCLHFAAQRNDRRLLECLVYNPDIDLTAKNNQGDTGYMIAKRNHPNYELWHNVPLHTPLRDLDLS